MPAKAHQTIHAETACQGVNSMPAPCIAIHQPAPDIRPNARTAANLARTMCRSDAGSVLIHAKVDLPRSRSINAWARKMANIELNEIAVGTRAEATDWD